MGQAIKDYVKFLAEARDAVDCLNCDQNTRQQLALEEERLEKELEGAKKTVADTISQTVQKRRADISDRYDIEISKAQERLRKVRAKREKAKNQGMKERIAEETRQFREQNQELKLEMDALFKREGVPGFCRTGLYYALYYPRRVKEFLTFLLAVLVCFLAVPNGIYALIPQHQSWQLVVIYFCDVVVFGGLYVAVNNRTKMGHQDALKKGREIRSGIEANKKKIRSVTRSIRKDGNEDIYNLEKFDDQISCIQQELEDTARKKQEALNTFENVTRTIISDEIMYNNKAKLEDLEKRHQEASQSLDQLEQKIKEESIHIADAFGPYLGREFLEADRLSELSKLIQSKRAENLTEAISLYEAERKQAGKN